MRERKDKFHATLADMIRDAVSEAAGGGPVGRATYELDEIADDLLDNLLWIADIKDAGRGDV